MLLFVPIFLLVPCSLAQIPAWGACPKVTVQPAFEISEYLGTWYEIKKLPVIYEAKGPRCIRAIYTLKADGHIQVDNKGYDKNNKTDGIIGDAYNPDPTEPAKLAVRFSELAPYGPYWVLDTDYVNYSLVFSCNEILGIGHFQSCWILARNRNPSKDIVKKLTMKAKSFGVKVNDFTTTDQTNCPDD